MDFKLNIYTIADIEKQIAVNLKRLRLEDELTRKTLSEKSGVSLSSIKRFETTGKISLYSLLRIVHVLGRLNEFEELFQNNDVTSIAELERTEAKKIRKRGRK